MMQEVYPFATIQYYEQIRCENKIDFRKHIQDVYGLNMGQGCNSEGWKPGQSKDPFLWEGFQL